MKVVDLFAGLGGFSAGAIAAGAEVILGVDHDPVPLKLWSANVSGGRAVLSSLGLSGDAVSLPPPSPHLHVHASTPCTDLSPARGRSATPADVASGVCMLRWALDLVIERGDYSWSLENVSTPKTREVLADYAARFPEKVAFATLDAADFGSPQTRIRLIAGQPALVKLLQEMPSSRRVSVREAFAAHGLEVPAPYLRAAASMVGAPSMAAGEMIVPLFASYEAANKTEELVDNALEDTDLTIDGIGTSPVNILLGEASAEEKKASVVVASRRPPVGPPV